MDVSSQLQIPFIPGRNILLLTTLGFWAGPKASMMAKRNIPTLIYGSHPVRTPPRELQIHNVTIWHSANYFHFIILHALSSF
jgi:hypothetical protein